MLNTRTVTCPVCGARHTAGPHVPAIVCKSCGTRIPLSSIPVVTSGAPLSAGRSGGFKPLVPQQSGGSHSGTVFVFLAIAAAVAIGLFVVVSRLVSQADAQRREALTAQVAIKPDIPDYLKEKTGESAKIDEPPAAKDPEPQQTAQTAGPPPPPPPQPETKPVEPADEPPPLEAIEIAEASDEPTDDFDKPPESDDEFAEEERCDEPEGDGAMIVSRAPEAHKPSILRPRPEAPLPPMYPDQTEYGKRRAAFKSGPHGVSFAKTEAREILKKAMSAIPRLLPSIARADKSGDQAELDRVWILQEAGSAAIDAIIAYEGGADFLDDFFNDPEWMEDFAGSGPAKHGMGRALQTLALLHWNDTGRWMLSTLEGRRVASAIALNCRPGAEEENTALFKTYERLAREGRLHASAYENTCPQWREVVNGGFSPRELKYMNYYKNDRYDTYAGVYHHVPYRMYNCFNEHIHKGHYYEPWLWLRQWAEIAVPVGGVCGALSTFGSRSAVAHGVPSVTCGQPDHCAFAFRNRDGTWRIGNYIERWTRPHWTVLGPGYHAIEALEYMYANPQAAALSERNRRLAETLRRIAAKRPDAKEASRSPKIEAAYKKAVELAPGNLLAWRSWLAWLKSTDAPDAAWDSFAALAAKSLAPSPWSGWEILEPYLERVAKNDPKRLLERLGAIHRTMREAPRSVPEPYDYSAILAKHEKLLGGDLKAKADLFDIVSAAQTGTRTFFDFATAWAGTVFMKSPETSGRFLKTIAKLADPATYSGRYLADRERAKNSGGHAPKIDFPSIIWAAAEAGNLPGFNEAVALCQKFEKKKEQPKRGKNDNKKKSPKFARTRFGGDIVSTGGVPMAYPLLADKRGNNPARWNAFCDEQPADRTVVKAAKSESPAIELTLPQPAMIRGIVVGNVEDEKLAACQSPLIISASEDGENWTPVLKEEPPEKGAQPVPKWEIDLHKNPIRARYLRAERQGSYTNAPFALSKIVVYGRKTK